MVLCRDFCRSFPYFVNVDSLTFLQAASIFGWYLFGRRRIIIHVDRDIGHVEVRRFENNSIISITYLYIQQISLFLSPYAELQDSEELIAWQVGCPL
jgi:hypothetical protein